MPATNSGMPISEEDAQAREEAGAQAMREGREWKDGVTAWDTAYEQAKMGADAAIGSAGKTASKAAAIEANRASEARFQYGGWAGGANEAAGRYAKIGSDAQGREGVKIDFVAADGTRGSALGMAGLMAARARGETPSIAGMMADRQMGQAAAEQSSAAASARGPAAMALAQQGAAANTAAMQSNISNGAQINAAQERLAAEQAAFGAYSGTSAQDAQRATEQARIEAAQRVQNDALQLGMTGYEVGVQSKQLDAQGNKVALETGANTSRLNTSATVGEAKAAREEARDRANLDKALGAVRDVTSGIGAMQKNPTAPASPGGSVPTPGSDDRMKRPASLMARGLSRGLMVSDDKAKLAAAWDAGNKAAVDSAQTLAKATPEELRRVSDDKNHPAHGVAAAVRATKAGAYDEGNDNARAQSAEAQAAKRDAEQSWMQKTGTAYPAAPGSPIERPAAWGAPAAPAPAPAPQAAPAPSMWGSMAGRMRTMSMSDEKTKDIAAISKEHDEQRAEVGTLGKQIPSSDMADAARSMRAVPYSYKDEYAQREGQAPGEVNVGPVAQEMEKSKVGATIVKPDPEGSGMRVIDQPKMVKALGGIVADQQDQLDEMRSLMARRLGGRK